MSRVKPSNRIDYAAGSERCVLYLENEARVKRKERKARQSRVNTFESYRRKNTANKINYKCIGRYATCIILSLSQELSISLCNIANTANITLYYGCRVIELWPCYISVSRRQIAYSWCDIATWSGLFSCDRIIPRCHWLSTYLERLFKKKGWKDGGLHSADVAAHYFQWGYSIICYRLVSNQMCPPRSLDDDVGGPPAAVTYTHPSLSCIVLLDQYIRKQTRIAHSQCEALPGPREQMVERSPCLSITAHHHYIAVLCTTIISGLTVFYFDTL